MSLRKVLAPVFLFAALAAATFGSIAATPAQAHDRHVRIINGTSHTLESFYASNVGRDMWEEDILGDDVLDPGESIVININDGSGYCRFDFMAVFDTGEEVVRRSIDVCTATSWTIYE